MFKVNLHFLSEQSAKQAYSEALNQAMAIENQPSALGEAGRVGYAFKVLLGLGRTVVDLDPTGSARMAVSICTDAWECLEQQGKQDEDLHELVKRLAGMAPSVEAVRDLADESLKETAMDMLDLIEDVSVFILSRRRPSTFQRWRGAISSDQEKQIQGYIMKFEELRRAFDTRIGVQGLRITATNRWLAEAELNAQLRDLNPEDLATFDPDRRCIQDTRAEIIAQLVDWAQTPNPVPGFAWMHGPAGFGKSSIATSVCVRLFEQRLLGSSFFCKRDAPNLRDPRRVLMTVVHELACRWEAYGRVVATAMRKDPGICTRHLRLVFEALVNQPLRYLVESQRPAQTLVVVVDALDECESISARKQLLGLLLAMSTFGPWLRILVTSRPDADIAEFFWDVSEDSFAEYDVVRYNASSDIRVFVQHQLRGVKKVKRWPDDAVDQISLHGGELFIWARTACKFILDGFDRLDRLTRVLSGTRMADIDALYTIAIKASILDTADDNVACMLACLGPVVVTATRTPLSVDNLAELLEGCVSQDAFRRVIASLSSVLYTDEKQSGAIRISHPSFMDYITSPDRSKELYVDLKQHNTVLAGCCLDTMTRGLKFNMCELETSDQFNSEVPNLRERVQDAISLYLEYSCLYWSSHVAHANSALLESKLREFVLGRKLLYWMEVLSLLEKLNTAPPTLLEVIECFGNQNMADCRMAANDAYRFVLSFYDAISSSTPHLYVSALAFAPSNSGIVQRMRRFFPKLLRVTEGGSKVWTPCLRTISGGTSVFNSVAFSPDSCRIVSACQNGTLHIWDGEAGNAALKLLTGHSNSAARVSVAFSPDGRRIVSAADKTMRVWDAETGEARLGPIQDHSNWVASVAFSPDSRRIVSGCGDGTIRVWSAETGEVVLGPLEGHSRCVRSVAFSPDGSRIVSGSLDKTMRVWDAETGEQVLQLLKEHSSAVISVAFSSDGRQVVSGTQNGTIRMWDAITGDVQPQTLTCPDSVYYSMAFSPDCSRIVCGSNDKVIRILDLHTGSLVQTLSGHLGPVWSVVFSPDGRRVASTGCAFDATIRIWDVVDIHKAETTEQAPSHSGHTEEVCCVAYSPDGRYVVSGSADTTVRIWDAETGDAALSPLEGHTGAVRCLTVSPDSRRVVSGSADATVRVWDAKTGEVVFEPLQGHTEEVSCVAFSRDYHLIVSGSRDQTVWIWSAESGQRALGPLTGHSNNVSAAVFSPDSHRVLSYSFGQAIHSWEVKTGTVMVTPLEDYPNNIRNTVSSSDRLHGLIYNNQQHISAHQPHISGYNPSLDDTGLLMKQGRAALSADGQRLVLVSDQSMHLWDTKTGCLIMHSSQWHWRGDGSIAFSSDVRWIAFTGAFRQLYVCSAETGELVLNPLMGREDLLTSVLSLTFSPDNRRLVSGFNDKSVRIWDIQSYTMSSTYTPKYLVGMLKFYLFRVS
ncbi:hypothetical protein FRC09_004926 [Ceratobasidium sp. 395]|nr:hypothetical protein FRC09_004926 [Ceratobasidium sp. 395]